jgi:hypothetical protein
MQYLVQGTSLDQCYSYDSMLDQVRKQNSISKPNPIN